MLSPKIRCARTGWVYLTLALLVLYVGQTFPHDHSVSGHSGDHAKHHGTPIPHSHSTHSHDHDTGDDTGEPWQAHHHHLAQHVDSHAVLAPSYGVNLNPGQNLRIARLIPAIEVEETNAYWSDVDIWVPETIPISPLDSRAPPAHD